jgi:hypothetical protein
MASARSGTAVWLAASVLLPIAVLSVYLVVSRRDLHFTAAGDYTAFAVAVGLGLACVVMLRLRWYWRLTASVAYLCAMGVLLAFYAFGFLCAALGNCL